VSAVPVAPPALTPGATMPAATFGPLTRTDFVRYAGAGGDFNPIHHDEPFAEAAGQPSVFGMGMLSAGFLGSRLADWVGPDNVLDFRVRFNGQVWPGETLTVSGELTAVEGGRGEVVLAVRSDGAGEVISATATVRLAGR